MEFIRYQTQHEEQVLALHRSAVEGFELGMSREEDEADLCAIEEIYLSSGGEFLVGVLEGEVVAMGGFRVAGEDVVELKRMRVRRDLQGKGLGSRLLVELEGRARAGGFARVVLETAKQRPLTLAFYEKHGYRAIGTGRYGSVEVVRFEKHLRGRRGGE